MGAGKRFEVIEAGVGSMGAAASYHLAKRGVKVLGLEQCESVPHCWGSHHGHSRAIRQSYYEHPDYVPLLVRAYALWGQLQAAWGREKLLHITGGVYLGARDGEMVRGCVASAREHGLPFEFLDHAALAARYPMFRLPENYAGFCEERAGLLVPEVAVKAHAKLSQAKGAELHIGEGMLEWKATNKGVSVRTGQGEYEADHLVVTAGAWAGSMLGDLGIKLEVTRQVLAWFEPKAEAAAQFALGSFPIWAIENMPPFGHYGFPMLESGQKGFKVAQHMPGEPASPGTLGAPENAPRADEIEGLRGFLREFLPEADGELKASAVCLYTNSPDSHFIVGAHPRRKNVTVACGFSGHGFKFASVIGEVLADLAMKGETELPVGFLSPKRFQ